jgi:hypothetical protein
MACCCIRTGRCKSVCRTENDAALLATISPLASAIPSDDVEQVSEMAGGKYQSEQINENVLSFPHFKRSEK